MSLFLKKEILNERPIRLSPNNYTKLLQTPWAGETLRNKYKADLLTNENIGESWELSFDPSMPSTIEDIERSLYDLGPFLKKELSLKENQNFDLLVKLLCTSENLSLQIHPKYKCKSLRSNESGKHESWLILEAEENSGIYLGLKDHVTLSKLKEGIERKENIAKLLNFIPVTPGDYFEIPPGTVHAIGQGITLLEPQRVLYGTRGITLRLWDWNRKYDKKGRTSDSGSERPLHIKECLDQISTENQQTKQSFALRKKPSKIFEWYSGKISCFNSNPYYLTHHCSLFQKGSMTVSIKQGYLHLLILNGAGSLEANSYEERVKAGDSFLITHKTPYFSLKGGEKLTASLIIPHETLANLNDSF